MPLSPPKNFSYIDRLAILNAVVTEEVINIRILLFWVLYIAVLTKKKAGNILFPAFYYYKKLIKLVLLDQSLKEFEFALFP